MGQACMSSLTHQVKGVKHGTQAHINHSQDGPLGVGIAEPEEFGQAMTFPLFEDMCPRG